MPFFAQGETTMQKAQKRAAKKAKHEHKRRTRRHQYSPKPPNVPEKRQVTTAEFRREVADLAAQVAFYGSFMPMRLPMPWRDIPTYGAGMP